MNLNRIPALNILMAGVLLFAIAPLHSQDTTILVDQKVVTLKEVVVRNNMDIPSFIRRIQFDTSFYRAFKNLRQLNYSSINDIRMMDKKGKVIASLESTIRQRVDRDCRQMEVLKETIGGDLKNRKNEWNYYTAEMYAALFFTEGMVCGAQQSVAEAELSLKKKKGLHKHKEQLKMLFFNPGRKIPGIPFIGNKINIYESPMARLYNFEMDMEYYQGRNAYTFKITPRPNLTDAERSSIVINQINTWFDAADMRIIARTYDMSYNTGIYDFNVQMEVEMGKINDLLVPITIRYIGNWKVATKKRERGIFTATIFQLSE